MSQFTHRVPNTEEGKTFLALEKKFRNKKTWRSRKRARGPRVKYAKKDGLGPRGYDLELPDKYATEWCLYLEEHPSVRNERWRQEQIWETTYKIRTLNDKIEAHHRHIEWLESA